MNEVKALVGYLTDNGYQHLRVVDDLVCCVQRFNFTYGLVVGIDYQGYERRYCYEHEYTARAALDAWDGRGHPTGPWIKCKGAGIDLLNPNLTV